MPTRAQAKSNASPSPATQLAGFVLLILAACSRRGADPASAITVRDSAGLVVVDNDLPRLDATCRVDSAPSLRIGVAEGKPEYELHRVFGATQLSDGRLVLVNQGSQELRYYDAQGKFLSRAGRAGEGPGEFRDAFYLWVLPGDTLYVGDYDPWQFLVFDPAGTWIRTVRPTPFYLNSPDVITLLDDGRAVLGDRTTGSDGDRGFELRRIKLVVHTPDGALTDTIGTYPDGRWGTVDPSPNAVRLFPLFESFTRVAAGGSRVVVGHTSQPELQIYDLRDSVRLERLVRWTIGDRSISQQEIAAERRRIAEPYKNLAAAERTRFLDPLVSEKRPVANQFPAFRNVLLARDGGIWFREFLRPTEPATQRWIGLDSTGRFRCRATLPPLGDLLEVGRDYLLLEERDADGVESIARYVLGPPSGR